MTDYDRGLIEGLRRDMRASHKTTESKPVTVIDLVTILALGYVAVKGIAIIAAMLAVL